MLPKALKSCPKSNKSPDLVTLTHSHSLFHFQKMIHNFLHKKNHFNYDLIGGHRHETILFLRNEFAPGCANLFTYKKCSLPRHLFGFAKGGGASQLSGFICAYHLQSQVQIPCTLSTLFPFIVKFGYYISHCIETWTKINQEGRVRLVFKN